MIDTIRTFFSRFSPLSALRYGVLSLVKKLADPDAILSYSQTGEDRILIRLLPKVRTGFYVEVGSNHPTHFSNTFALYRRGWRGITIDANAKLVALHKRLRRLDIPLCAAVSDVEEAVVFTEYDTHELSTICKETVATLKKQTQTIRSETTVQTTTLTTLLDKYLPANTAIDLLTIDVEGHDFNVLLSLDLTVYRPKVIVIEMHDFRFDSYLEDPVFRHLNAHDYVFHSYAVWNGYFIERHYLNGKR